MTKLCKKCNTEKPLAEFHNDTKRKGGRYPNCKVCTNVYARNRYTKSETKQKIRQYLADQRQADPMGFAAAARQRSEKCFQSIKGRAQSLLRCAKRSPDGCSLTLEWVMRGIERGVCPVTGIAFDLTNGHQKITGRAKNPYAPSLDRIHPKGPYSPENTRLVIWQYNMMKGELTDDEIAYICALIASNRKRAAA